MDIPAQEVRTLCNAGTSSPLGPTGSPLYRADVEDDIKWAKPKFSPSQSGHPSALQPPVTFTRSCQPPERLMQQTNIDTFVVRQTQLRQAKLAAPPGMINHGNTCYLNATLQVP